MLREGKHDLNQRKPLEEPHLRKGSFLEPWARKIGEQRHGLGRERFAKAGKKELLELIMEMRQ